MTDFFREVDEEVRRDKAIEFFKRHQVLIIVLAAAVLIGTGVWKFWQTRNEQAAQAAGARYEAAVQLARDGKDAEAETALKQIAAQGPAGYALLARFRAAALTSEKNPEEAAKMYDALGADSKIDSTFRDLAELRAAMLRVDHADAKEIAQKIEPLAGPGNPFHASARELLALAALKRGDFAAAGKWLDMIVTDPQAPVAMRQRAEALSGLVAGGGKFTPTPAPAGTDAPKTDATKTDATKSEAPAAPAPVSTAPAPTPASPAPAAPATPAPAPAGK